MQLVSSFLGAGILGGDGATVNGVDFTPDGRALAGFDTTRGYLPYRCVKVANDITMLSDAAFEPMRPVINPIGSMLTDENGRKIGRISDAAMRGGNVTSYLVERPFRLSGRTLEIGETVTVFRREPRPKSPAALLDTAVRVTLHEPDSESVSTEKELTEFIPARIIGDYAFLLGRVVTADIESESGVIIRRGEVIVAHTVAVARKHFKLFDLTVKSKS